MVDLIFTYYAPDDDVPEEVFEITSPSDAETCGLRATRTRLRQVTSASAGWEFLDQEQD